jgi:DNA polymerase III epsilon subunit-like protein
MKAFSSTILTQLETDLETIRLEVKELIKAADQSIKTLLSTIQKLKAETVKHKFKNEAEEVDFFKNIKPKFISKLIYHNKAFNI